MKPWVIVAAFCLLGVAPSFAADRPETLAELKLRADATPPDECVRVCAGVARRALEEARDQFAAGADGTAQALISEVKTYADKAVEAATHTKKHEKQL